MIVNEISLVIQNRNTKEIYAKPQAIGDEKEKIERELAKRKRARGTKES